MLEAFLSSDLVKIMTALLAMITTATLIYQRFKQIDHSNKSVKMSQIDLYMKIRKESLEDRLSVELMFQHLFNKAIPYDDICLLFQMDSPSLAIQDYLKGNDFVKIEDNSIVYQKKGMEKSLKIFGYFYVVAYFTLSILTTGMLILMIYADQQSFISLLLGVVVSIVLVVICFNEISKNRSAIRATKYVKLSES